MASEEKETWKVWVGFSLASSAEMKRCMKWSLPLATNSPLKYPEITKWTSAWWVFRGVGRNSSFRSQSRRRRRRRFTDVSNRHAVAFIFWIYKNKIRRYSHGERAHSGLLIYITFSEWVLLYNVFIRFPYAMLTSLVNGNYLEMLKIIFTQSYQIWNGSWFHNTNWGLMQLM